MLNVKDLGFSYSATGNSQLQFIKDIQIEQKQGEILGVIARNSQHKKAFVDCLTLLAKPISGTITLGHQNLTVLTGSALRNVRTQIGFASYKNNFTESQTCYANLTLPLRLKGLDTLEIRHVAEPLAQYFDLNNLKTRYPKELSNFERRKLTLARALINRPRLLILDEITTGLDIKSYQQTLKLIKKTKADFDYTAIAFTKDLEAAKSFCTSIAILQNDQLVNEGNCAQFFVNPKHICSKELIRTYARTELPWSIRSKLKKNHEPNDHAILRAAFTEAIAPEILLNQVITNYGVKINIINSYSEVIQNYGCHFSYIEIYGNSEQIEATLAFLNENRLHTEVLGYVA